MNTDIALVVGMLLVVLSIPAIFSAFSEGRAPRVAALLLLIGGGTMVWALHGKPGGIRLEEIPQAVVRVVAMIVN